MSKFGFPLKNHLSALGFQIVTSFGKPKLAAHCP